MGDHQHGAIGRAHCIDPARHDSQGVDVQSRIGFVQDAELRLEKKHLEDLVAFLLAAGKAFVDGPVHQLSGHLHEFHLLLAEGEEIHCIEFFLAPMRADGIHRGLEEITVPHPGNLHRVLEGEEHTLASPNFSGHIQ